MSRICKFGENTMTKDKKMINKLPIYWGYMDGIDLSKLDLWAINGSGLEMVHSQGRTKDSSAR